MKKLFAIAAMLLLAACATVGSPAQGIYAAYATYSIAVKTAADYAEGPTAEPAIVAKMNAANKRPDVQDAVRYGRAYVLCAGQPSGVVGDVQCQLFDFRASTASGYALLLRNTAYALLPERN